MVGKKLDRTRLDGSKARTALEVVRESPTIALITVAPAVVVFGVVWWLFGFWAAILLAVIFGVGAVVTRKLR
ncbi:hypothetical protein [Rhodococcus sp. ARC_M6]|uniref:hypothetical protein n=1 Tax=Rhodococcus sp. ARC_M6 TaxID=2928852 RepID=UPI001FB316AE|nr:hypothetical protein [Rhodococcus sp. ARC_M6]MCJ0903916.1 hypothetical protein [Rhodococcus sp. ARC_M6]